MNAKLLRRILVVAVLGLSLSIAAGAHAQCCGAGYSAYYPGSYTAAYSPVAYSSSYSSWYPGYWLNRVSARLWGSPTTYVASYPTTHYASYAPSYTVGYRPAYSVGYAASHATSYAAPACSSCSTCTSCPSYSVGYSSCSTCTTACSPGSGCSTCAAPAVSQAAYQQAPGCASCGKQTAVVGPAPQAAPGPTPAPQGTYGTQNGAPSLPPSAEVPTERQQDTQRPANGEQQPVQPAPGSDTNETNPYDVETDSSTYFQAPKLFDPNDRTAQRSIAPVTTALYQKPVSYRNATAQRITRQQAESDAAGWISASK